MNGQQEYVWMTVHIPFDPDYVDCDHCPMMHGWERKQCDRTGEFIVDGKSLGKWCPGIIHALGYCPFPRPTEGAQADVEA